MSDVPDEDEDQASDRAQAAHEDRLKDEDHGGGMEGMTAPEGHVVTVEGVVEDDADSISVICTCEWWRSLGASPKPAALLAAEHLHYARVRVGDG
jgi:hypothetical protein